MTNPQLITTPFAENGTKNTIPEGGAAEPQLATMQAGFPEITQRPINEGGIPPERADFNGILNLYGQHLVHINKGLPYEFDQGFANSIGGYPTNARVMLANGDIVQNTQDANTNNPNLNMSGWKSNSPDDIKHNSLKDRDAADAHPANAINYGSINQEAYNDGLNSISDMLAINNPKHGMRVFVKHFDLDQGILGGGGTFIYDSTKAAINDGVVVFNGWVRQLTNNTLTPYMAGAKGDYVDQTNKGTDDSSAFQKVVAYFAETPSVIECDPQAKYYIANPVIIPDYTDIRGNGAGLFGNSRTNDCFYTGYYVNGILTSLVDKPENTKFLTNTKLRGFRYRHFKSSMKLRGMTQGCAIEDVRSYECDQHLWSREHYFCTFRQSYADWCGTGTAETPVDERTAVYDLWTLNGMINIETIQCSSASLAYVFYSLQSTELSHLDAESCVTAIRLRGEIESPDIHGCYFENCGTVLDISGAVVIGGALRNNFINHCDVGILATNASGHFNEFDNRWRGSIGARSQDATGAFRLFSKAENKFVAYNATYPADNTPLGAVTNKNTGYATGNGLSEQMITVYNSNAGNNMLQAKSYMGSTVPYVFFGKYPIANITNSIPFCTHTAGALQPDNTFSIRITTSIAYSEFIRGDFALHVNTTGNEGKIFGRFFGLKGAVEFNGFTLFTPTITIENVSGVIVIVLSGIKNTNNSTTYQCRGLVKLA